MRFIFKGTFLSLRKPLVCVVICTILSDRLHYQVGHIVFFRQCENIHWFCLFSLLYFYTVYIFSFFLESYLFQFLYDFCYCFELLLWATLFHLWDFLHAAMFMLIDLLSSACSENYFCSNLIISVSSFFFFFFCCSAGFFFLINFNCLSEFCLV